jgi:hypothetical protein
LTLNNREQVAPLLTTQPSDALASYFALEHDARRTKLTVRAAADGKVLAFVAVCQTGIDLFRPLVVMRGDDSDSLRDALQAALTRGRQYLFSAPITLVSDLQTVVNLYGETRNRIFTLSQNDFKPVVNVLVRTSHSPDGLLRAAIAARDGSNAAEAGTTWQSTRYAEVYVRVAESVRRRGLGKSVVSAVSAQVLELKRTPIYMAADENIASQRLALSLGYSDTGKWELSGAMSLK